MPLLNIKLCDFGLLVLFTLAFLVISSTAYQLSPDSPLADSSLRLLLNIGLHSAPGSISFSNLPTSNISTHVDSSTLSQQVPIQAVDPIEDYTERVREIFKSQLEETWARYYENLTLLVRLDDLLNERIASDAGRWKELVANCSDTDDVYIQLLDTSFLATYPAFHKAWSKSFALSYAEIVEEHVDSILEKAVRAVVEEVWNTTLEDLGINWKIACYDIARAMRSWSLRAGRKAGKASPSVFMLGRVGSLLFKKSQESGSESNGSVFAQEGNRETSVLEELPDGVTPIDVLLIILRVVQDELSTDDYIDSWTESWKRIYGENVEKNEKLQDFLQSTIEKVYYDPKLKIDCQTLVAQSGQLYDYFETEDAQNRRKRTRIVENPSI